MKPSSLRVRDTGHGHVGSLDVKIDTFLGETEERRRSIGQRSAQYRFARVFLPVMLRSLGPEPLQRPMDGVVLWRYEPREQDHSAQGFSLMILESSLPSPGSKYQYPFDPSK